MIRELAFTFLAWLLILPSTFMLGRLFHALIPVQDRLFRGLFYFAAGLAVHSNAVLLISYAGLLRPAFLWAYLLLLSGFSFFTCKELTEWMKGWLPYFVSPRGDRQHLFLSILTAAASLSLLAGTLSPEIGGDSLCYQLNLPKEFLRRGSLQPILYDDNSYFPLFMNNLYLIGLATGGVFAAKLFHFFTGVLLVLALIHTAYLETAHKKLSLFSGLAVWLTPTVFNLLSTTYVDVSVALYPFLAFLSLKFAFENRAYRGLVLSGFLMGCAVAIKYYSLVCAMALAAVWLFYALEQKRFLGALRLAPIWTGAFFLAGGYWLIRNWFLTGNPIYPYWGALFGHPNQRPPIFFYDMGMGKNLWSFFLVLLNMAIHPSNFGLFTTRLSILYFLLLPFAVLAVFLSRRSRSYFVYFLGFYVVWFFLVQADRWFIPCLPPLVVSAAIGMDAAYRKYGGRIQRFIKSGLGTAALLILTVEALGGIYHYRYPYLLFTGLWSPSVYLRKMERTLPIADWINANLKPDAKILLEEFELRKFYIQREIISDANLSWHTKYREAGESPAEIRQFLKSLGVTHILTRHSLSKAEQPPSPLRQFVEEGWGKLLVEVSSENIRDERFRYFLYELKS